MISGDASSGCRPFGFMLAVAELALLLLDAATDDRRVGRFGVDFDWKLCGTGRGFCGAPLLWGGPP